MKARLYMAILVATVCESRPLSYVPGVATAWSCHWFYGVTGTVHVHCCHKLYRPLTEAKIAVTAVINTFSYVSKTLCMSDK